ncbi:hypothetical protein BFV94_4652 [Alteromonas macleodii]|uniref:Uncharacterized protein n=1 Tax=Alteromonas macleodii TaxID=28108 RepID=A0AB36FKM4_ALTMA|nr:hypothetical protein BFV95_4876 [Alteromonas macleodii]OES24291.1 hypothetical protein BFV93_4725 [Alteromonas macleodii]OES24727.1 hypothetical protein BFV94_4652 [Alteromonas macleodii]OES38980.1 hypothetical protein BFV96_4447 [Alteromonas macleodii]
MQQIAAVVLAATAAPLRFITLSNNLCWFFATYKHIPQ